MEINRKSDDRALGYCLAQPIDLQETEQISGGTQLSLVSSTTQSIRPTGYTGAMDAVAEVTVDF